jgi:hypothetical protein
MMISRNKILILTFLFILNNLLFSNEPTLKTRIDTNNVLIGDQINLYFEFQSPKKINVVFPAFPDSIGKLEVIAKSKIDTLINNESFKLTQKFTLTSFDSGSFVIDPFTLMYEREGFKELYPLESERFVLNFATVPVDTAQGYKDIKPVMEISIDWKEYLIYIIIGIVLIIITILIIYLLRRRKRKPKTEDLGYDPTIPPYVLAYESLKQLDAEKLWQKGYVKEYYIRLTDILRLYIERQLKIDALEMISEEIIISLKKLNLKNDLVDKMKVLFDNADLAKFAKTEPLPDINTLNLNTAFEFLNATNIEKNNSEQSKEKRSE